MQGLSNPSDFWLRALFGSNRIDVLVMVQVWQNIDRSLMGLTLAR